MNIRVFTAWVLVCTRTLFLLAYEFMFMCVCVCVCVCVSPFLYIRMGITYYHRRSAYEISTYCKYQFTYFSLSLAYVTYVYGEWIADKAAGFEDKLENPRIAFTMPSIGE